jgi:hypothetical protein
LSGSAEPRPSSASTAPRLSLAAVVASRRPPRWVGAALERIGALDAVRLDHVLVDPEPAGRRVPGAVQTILRLYSLADARAFPLRSSGLDTAPLPESLGRLISADASGVTVDVVVDLRLDGDARRYVDIARMGVLAPRNELVAPGDRSVLDAVRRLSPVSSKVELIDATGPRVVAETIGACHALSPRRTLDAACRRSEVLLARALQRLAHAP